MKRMFSYLALTLAPLAALLGAAIPATPAVHAATTPGARACAVTVQVYNDAGQSIAGYVEHATVTVRGLQSCADAQSLQAHANGPDAHLAARYVSGATITAPKATARIATRCRTRSARGGVTPSYWDGGGATANCSAGQPITVSYFVHISTSGFVRIHEYNSIYGDGYYDINFNEPQGGVEDSAHANGDSATQYNQSVHVWSVGGSNTIGSYAQYDRFDCY